jgi:hypothetical protein
LLFGPCRASFGSRFERLMLFKPQALPEVYGLF